MHSAEHYKERAAQFRRWAEESYLLREHFEALARDYDLLAASIDCLSAGEPPREEQP